MLSAHFPIEYIEQQSDIQTKEKFDHAIFPDFNRSKLALDEYILTLRSFHGITFWQHLHL